MSSQLPGGSQYQPYNTGIRKSQNPSMSGRSAVPTNYSSVSRRSREEREGSYDKFEDTAKKVVMVQRMSSQEEINALKRENEELRRQAAAKSVINPQTIVDLSPEDFERLVRVRSDRSSNRGSQHNQGAMMRPAIDAGRISSTPQHPQNFRANSTVSGWMKHQEFPNEAPLMQAEQSRYPQSYIAHHDTPGPLKFIKNVDQEPSQPVNPLNRGRGPGSIRYDIHDGYTVMPEIPQYWQGPGQK